MDIELGERVPVTRRIRVFWRRIAIILASAAFMGLLTLSIALSRDANLRVFGMVEIARAYTVDINGSISSDFVLDPALVVRMLNAEEQKRRGSRGAARHEGEVHAVARLARGGSLVELEAVSSSLAVAEHRIDEMVEAIRRQAEPIRERARARVNMLDGESRAEMLRLGDWLDKLNPLQASKAKRGSDMSDSLSMMAMGMMRADAERQLHKIQTQRRAYLAALNLMEERRTRLVVPVFVETSFPSSSVAIGLAGFFVGALATTAVFFVRRRPLISIA